MEKAAITIAAGKPLYFRMAATLARSYCFWNRDIPFCLITDETSSVPSDLKRLDGVHVLRRSLADIGKGFSVKLHMDRLSPAEETLFIDADCLVTDSVNSIFSRLQRWSVTTIGELLNTGEWFGDLQSRCDRFEVSRVPVFVGSLYYFKKDDTAKRVFETARDLVDQYDELGYVRLRGVPNEEPLISTGMALQGQEPVEDDGTIKADAMNFLESIEIDVFEGISRFVGNGEKQTSWGLREAHPIIGHFNARYANIPPYTREQEKLSRFYQDGWSRRSADVYARLKEDVPHRLLNGVKDLGRPLYHTLFGPREVKKSERVPDY